MTVMLGLTALAVNTTASDPLPRSSPEAQGISSLDIRKFVEAVEKQHADLVHSFMVVRHGYVVAEGWWAPYRAVSPHEVNSLSKSFTSTAIGLAIAEGRLSLYDRVLPFFPESAPAEPSANLKAMRIRDLLIMSSGHETGLTLSDNNRDDWAKLFLSQPVPYAPGTRYRYDSGASYMLSAIVQKVTGMTLRDYLQPRLFAPLGIDKPEWDTSPQGMSAGGFGLHLHTEDMAKFGLLYLQKGNWRGQQVVPASWVAQATSLQTSTGSDPVSDYEQGCGYHFWRCQHGIYRGSGAYGQYCIVMPEQDAVLAVTAGMPEAQVFMNLMWDSFIPAMQPRALPANDAARIALERKLASLSLSTEPGATSSDRAAAIVGRKYIFPENDQNLRAVALTSGADGATTVTWRFADKEQTATVRPGSWQECRLGYGKSPEKPWAVSGAWTATDTFTLKMCAYESSLIQTVTFHFEGEELHYGVTFNVLPKLPEVVGHLQ